MATMQDVVNLARIDLNDEDKVRYLDAVLLKFLSNFIQESIKLRPDLFISSIFRLPSYNLTITDIFPLPDRYIRSCADYVIARAKLIGTEEGSMTEASAYLGLSVKSGGG